MTANEYLEKLLEDNKIPEEELNNIRAKRDEVETKLRGHFGDKILTIKYSGSIAKKTAINASKDLDLAVHFKKDSYGSLKQMYEDVYDLLCQHYIAVQKQNVSIGLSLENVDVVPGRRIEDGSNNDVNLFRKDTEGSIKTNLETHKDYIKNSNCRKIIRLLKIWKNAHALKFKSFALEILVIKALDGFEGTSLTAKTKKVLEFIETNVRTITLIDPANTNNNISDAIDDFKKIMLQGTASSSLGHLKKIEDGNETELSAWKKVFNDYSSTTENTFSLNSASSRATADWGEQPARRHGED